MIVKYKNTDFFCIAEEFSKVFYVQMAKSAFVQEETRKDATQDVLNLYNLNESAISRRVLTSTVAPMPGCSAWLS